MTAPSPIAELAIKAIAWAKAQSDAVLESGLPLSADGIQIARKVDVTEPELVRIQWVTRLPVPDDPIFQPLLENTRLADMAGLTLGYAIFLVQERTDLKLIAHELRHVHQYERLGGIDGFMPVYLEEIRVFGYTDAPLEKDARAHEICAFPSN